MSGTVEGTTSPEEIPHLANESRDEISELIPGMKLAATHDLTQKEINLLLCFLENGPMNAAEAAEKLGVNKSTLHHNVKTLKLKKLLKLKKHGEDGSYIYEALV